MTTATAPRHPSPADLAAISPARRRAQSRLADLLAPATLDPKARFRVEFGRAIRASGMTPHTRLVALMLAMSGNYRTGHIVAHRQPRLHGLAQATGLTVGQVAVALKTLEARGWVSRTGSPDYDKAELRPRIPQHAVPSLIQH